MRATRRAANRLPADRLQGTAGFSAARPLASSSSMNSSARSNCSAVPGISASDHGTTVMLLKVLVFSVPLKLLTARPTTTF